MPYIPSNPEPEPAGDIRAQLAAVLDPQHPKRACYMVPGNAARLNLKALPKGAFAVSREEGTLVTVDRNLAEQYHAAPTAPEAFDRVMAEILGYPEAKPDIGPRCGNDARLSRTVQARDGRGRVIIEAVTSAAWFLRTCVALERHGHLVIISPAAALSRRAAMRWVE